MIRPVLLNFVLFAFGASLGSFANVCIYRIPLKLSVVAPRSFCPHCKRTLTWYELIPVVSYLLLAGRCRTCNSRISLQYPFVELASGLLGFYLVTRYSVTLFTVFAMPLLLLLIIIAVIDWRNLIIPNSLVIAGLLLGIIDLSFLSAHLLLSAALSAVLASGFTFVVRAAGNFIFRKDTMGIGDIKLAGLIGLFIGFEHFLVAVWFAAILGIIYWSIQRVLNRTAKDLRLPFGTFLSVTAIIIYLATAPSIPFIR